MLLSSNVTHYKNVATNVVTAMSVVLLKMNEIKGLTRSVQSDLKDWTINEAPEEFKGANHGEAGDKKL